MLYKFVKNGNLGYNFGLLRYREKVIPMFRWVPLEAIKKCIAAVMKGDPSGKVRKNRQHRRLF